MDSFSLIPVEIISDELDEVLGSLDPLPEDAVPAARQYISFSQALNEIWQLYSMFCWNIERYHEGVTCTLGDVVSTNASCISDEDILSRTWADVNCFACNIISSGHTLIESLRRFMKKDIIRSNSQGTSFEKYLNDLYDREGVYPLCCELRNYAQHGQALVSVYVDNQGKVRAAFDFNQLKKPLHFKINTRFTEYLQKKTDVIDANGGFHHRISFGWTLERYHLTVLDIVQKFYNLSSDNVELAENEFRDYLVEHPECLGTIANGSDIAYFSDGSTFEIVTGLEQSQVANHNERKRLVSERLTEATSLVDLSTYEAQSSMRYIGE